LILGTGLETRGPTHITHVNSVGGLAVCRYTTDRYAGRCRGFAGILHAGTCIKLHAGPAPAGLLGMMTNGATTKINDY